MTSTFARYATYNTKYKPYAQLTDLPASVLQGSNASFAPYYMINLGIRVFELCVYMFTPIFTFNDAVHATETYPLAKA